MIPSAILGRYAKSIVDVAFEENQEPAVTEDLKTYREIFQAVPDLLDVFHSPAVPRESKEKLLAELIRIYPVTGLTANFLRILIQHNRIRYFQQVFENYQKLVNERKGIVAARVTTAAPLSEVELKSLRDSLAGITGKAVTLDVQTDNSLLGGLVVQVGSTIFDGSVRTQLAEMKQRLAAV